MVIIMIQYDQFLIICICMNIIYISIRALLIDSTYESIYENLKLLVLTYEHFQGLP